MPNDLPAGSFPAEVWDAAHEILLALARDVNNIKRVAAVLQQMHWSAKGQYASDRRAWDNTPMACGHERRHFKPSGDVEKFVGDPEKHGYCVVCRAVAEAKEAAHV